MKLSPIWICILLVTFLAGMSAAILGITWDDIRELAGIPQTSPSVSLAPVATPTPTPQPRDITMVFVGDIMLSRSVGAEMASRSDYYWPLREIDDYIQPFDIAFANLETTISSRGTRVGSIYSFRSDPRVAPALASADFDVLSIANNHIWDYGQVAFLDTLDHVKRAGMVYVGGGVNSDEAHAGIIKDVEGTKIGFLAYTDLLPKRVSATLTTPGVSFMVLDQVKLDIAAMRPAVDVVVVSFHWGEEYQLTHNQHQETIARAALEAGADFIIGHHPHVRQDIQVYDGKTVAYSAGNFIFDQTFSKETMTGAAIEVTVRSGSIIDIKKRDVAISRRYQPSLAN